jgi:hypothetical protein
VESEEIQIQATSLTRLLILKPEGKRRCSRVEGVERILRTLRFRDVGMYKIIGRKTIIAFSLLDHEYNPEEWWKQAVWRDNCFFLTAMAMASASANNS